MKNKFLLFVLFGFSSNTFAQEQINIQDKYTENNKGKFFVSWGGNRDNYSKSDITFKGKDYNFTIKNADAHDKPKGWHVDYVNPVRMTIPQTNFRLGYFISNKYSVAIGVDHMKYVMAQDKAVKLNGFYPNPGTYDELLPNNQILLTEKFLTYEHTDGLNYVNTEVSRHDDISKLFRLPNIDKVQINVTEGLGFGMLYPKTNTMLLGKQRHDDFHVSGFGTSLKAGLNVTFFKHFYIQGELKGGYINMQDIRTTQSIEDSASQDFFFFQRIIAFGGIFRV
ncbi:hypothetical protein RCH18_002730 [Flavobacterium sp. PL11]|uniref:hypothetical protein n=1 Tax=Flavobacterium sp. PL11 TaxID=3071717 RepID=UPI002E07F5A7|nr:hypothetical protein [Flavobacterium sp. PL11]